MITAPLVGTLRNFFQTQDLRIWSQALWGAQSPEHRQLLRAHAARALNSQAEEIFELSKPLTRFEENYISISHSKECGVIGMAPFPLGIDVESLARVKKEIVARMVINPSELQNAPHPAALWSAKEASFKALVHFAQPSAMSQIEIGNWHQLDSQMSSFQIKNGEDFKAPSGKGLVICNETSCLALFVFSC